MSARRVGCPIEQLADSKNLGGSRSACVRSTQVSTAAPVARSMTRRDDTHEVVAVGGVADRDEVDAKRVVRDGYEWLWRATTRTQDCRS